MTRLQKALDIWMSAGHSQAELRRLTGIDHATCSRLCSGKRGLTLEQRIAIFEAFREKDLHQGLLLLKADLEDNIPSAAREFVRIILEEPLTLREDAPAVNRVQKVKRRLMDELSSDDPDALDIALALYKWKEAE